MRTLTFYNEKGGVGKTSHCVLMASWLAYAMGRRVMVYDFDSPMFHVWNLREKEAALLADDAASRNLRRHVIGGDAYSVMRLQPDAEHGSFSASSVSRTVLPALRAYRARDMFDYVLFDFPGRYYDGDILSTIARAGFLDFAAVPVGTDEKSVKSGLFVCGSILRSLDVACRPFFNRISKQDYDSPDGRFCSSVRGLFAEDGFDMFSTRIKSFTSMDRDGREQFFVQSTVCWPESNVRRLCPDLPDLYSEIIGEIERIK